jgi:fluoride exporter
LNILYIAGFGLIGIFSRYAIDKSLVNVSQSLPVSTFIINIVGSFIAGLIFAISERHEISSALHTGLLVGFCGGFTTFSAYALQIFMLTDKQKFLPAIAYMVTSPILGLLAAGLPIFLVRRFAG